MKCSICDLDLQTSNEIAREYCDVCQQHIRTVFDKDAFALGQYKQTEGGDLINTLEWTTYQDEEEGVVL